MKKLISITILLFIALGCTNSEHKTENEVSKNLTYDENHQRADLVAQALSKKKILNSVIFFDEMKKIIQIEIKRPTDVKAPTLDDMIDSIKEELKQSSLRKEAKSIAKSDLDLKIIRGEGDIVTLE